MRDRAQPIERGHPPSPPGLVPLERLERRQRRGHRGRRVGRPTADAALAPGGAVVDAHAAPGDHAGVRGRVVWAGLVAVGLLLASLLAVPLPGVVLVGVLAVVAWPVMGRVARRRAADRRLAVRSEAAPAVLDLLGAALLAGLNPHKAVLRVAERAPEALQEDLGLAAAVVRLGGTPAAALRAAADRSGLDELRAAAAALEAAERWGAPPAEALAARAEALRSRTRLHAEAEAGRAAVRLAFPLVLCFLPAFVLLTVVPTVAGSLRALTP